MIADSLTMHVLQSIREHLPRTVECEVITPGHGRAQGIEFLARQRVVISKLWNFAPDIVLTDLVGNPSWYAKMYSLLSGRRVPLVVLLRGDLWNEFDSYVSTMDYPSKLFGPVYEFSWMRGLRFADQILAVCDWLKEIVLERYPNKRVEMLHLGINPSDFLEDDGSRFDFRSPAVGILQNNVILPKVKGLLWFSTVVEKMPNVDFYLAGDGPFTHLVENTFSGMPNVHLVGHLQYPGEVRKFHRSTDVYVLASGLDCCPASLLEASLCESPVVASRVGGVPELVQEGNTGWTIPNGKTNLWVAKIRELLDDQGLAKRFGSNGRTFVTRNFSPAMQASKLVSLLKEIAAG